MSDTKNVKLGVCKVFYGGVDLGYTQGGVQATVKTETHKVNVDQFGKTTVNELIMSRDVTVKVPLAETTLQNLVAVMPGSTLNIVGGAKATGKITIATVPANNDTVTVSSKVFTFKTAPQAPADVLIGATVAETATNLHAKLVADQTANVSRAVFTVAAAQITVTYGLVGTAGNSYALIAGQASVTTIAMAGGTEPTSQNVTVTTGISISLLDGAKELRLHPQNKPANDTTEDFVIPLAATPGGLEFAYEVEKERIYNTEFMGYPNPDTGDLFYIGSK